MAAPRDAGPFGCSRPGVRCAAGTRALSDVLAPRSEPIVSLSGKLIGDVRLVPAVGTGETDHVHRIPPSAAAPVPPARCTWLATSDPSPPATPAVAWGRGG